MASFGWVPAWISASGSGDNNFNQDMYPNSLITITNHVGPFLAAFLPNRNFQLVRHEYSVADQVVLDPQKEEYSRTRVDGCVIVNKTACDWWVAHGASGIVLVELKGRDVEHAIEQIEATFDYLSKKICY